MSYDCKGCVCPWGIQIGPFAVNETIDPTVNEKSGSRRAFGNSEWMISFRKSASGVDGFLGDGTPIPKTEVEKALSSGVLVQPSLWVIHAVREQLLLMLKWKFHTPQTGTHKGIKIHLSSNSPTIMW